MIRAWSWLLGAVAFAFSVAAETPSRLHRSPIDVAVLPGTGRVLTANHTSDSASLVDLAAGRVLAELSCGRRPSGVACSRNGRRAAVSNLWSGTLTFLDVEGTKLRVAGTVLVGAQPRGVVFSADGTRLYVAVAGDNEVVEVSWQEQKLLRRWPAPAEPRRLAIT